MLYKTNTRTRKKNEITIMFTYYHCSLTFQFCPATGAYDNELCLNMLLSFQNHYNCDPFVHNEPCTYFVAIYLKIYVEKKANTKSLKERNL